MLNYKLDDEIKQILNVDHELSREIFSCDRKRIIDIFYSTQVPIPINADNIVKIINAGKKINEKLLEKTSVYIRII